MIGKISRPKTLACRYIACLLAATVVNVFAGTAPAPAQGGGWSYAWANGKCWMTMSNAAMQAGMPAPDPRIWRSATNDRCRNVPVAASKLPFEASPMLGMGGVRSNQPASGTPTFPGKQR